MQFRTHNNYKNFNCRKETNSLPSLTLPDQSMSIKEIMDRYAKGLPLGGERVPLYDEENDLPDPRTLDLSEREDLQNQYAEELVELRVKHQKKPSKKADLVPPVEPPSTNIP